MRNYNKKLYKKFKTRMIKTLSGDHFYEYFMKVIDSGVKFYAQKNELVIKTIDEKWVDALTDALPALDNIIRNPRRTFVRDEVIVPIELARKTGADAVRHLSTHTHFIDRLDDKGSIVPKKIMNVYNEDSYNIYENRFIITLINVMDQFLTRRYNAIFGQMGNEFSSMLKVDHKFEDKDYDEKIAYNLTLNIHQGKSYFGQPENLEEIYKKIEHIRKMLNGFKQSEFCLALANCTPVKSPIKRTNLIVKQHHFRKCYDLWYFLEKYTGAGFSIEKIEKEGAFDETYISEINTLALFNYLAMKNSLEDENKKLVDPLNYRKRRTIKPKFVSRIIDDFVADFDITEKDLRKLIDKMIKKAYTQKHKNNEDKIIITLTTALNNGIQKQQSIIKEEKIITALQDIFNVKSNEKAEQKQQAEITAILEKS